MTAKHNLVRNAFAVLRAFQGADEQLTCLELSRRSHLPRASGHRLVQTLEEIGAISRGTNGRYRLGIMLASLSRNVAIGDLLRNISGQIMDALANKLNVTVHMGVLEGDMVTYIAKVSLPTSFAIRTSVGAQLEPYCSGLGKVLLAALPDESLDSFLSAGNLIALTSRTITKAPLLLAELEMTRARGFAIDNGECLDNMFCVAAPIKDGSGHTIAAISVTDDALGMSAERQDSLVQEVLAAAFAINERIAPGRQNLREFSPNASSSMPFVNQGAANLDRNAMEAN